jgi:hypothetical protein
VKHLLATTSKWETLVIRNPAWAVSSFHGNVSYLHVIIRGMISLRSIARSRLGSLILEPRISLPESVWQVRKLVLARQVLALELLAEPNVNVNVTYRPCDGTGDERYM